MDFEKLVLIYIILFTMLATGFAAALLENAKLTRENERLKKILYRRGYKLSAVLPAEAWERLDDCGEGWAAADCHYSGKKDVGISLQAGAGIMAAMRTERRGGRKEGMGGGKEHEISSVRTLRGAFRPRGEM